MSVTMGDSGEGSRASSSQSVSSTGSSTTATEVDDIVPMNVEHAGAVDDRSRAEDGDVDVPTPGTPESDAETQRAFRKHRVCWRLPLAGGRGRWVIAGPVVDQDEVDPFHFSVAILVEGLSTFTCREVYARAVPMLVEKGVYASTAAAYPSVRHVATEPDSTTSSAQEEPSWSATEPEGVPVRRVLDRAAAAVKRSGKHVVKGCVKFIAFVPLSSHPWYAHAMHLQRRRDQRHGAIAYKRALSRMTDDDERRLLCSANSASLLAVRHSTTYRLRSPAEREQGLRAIKKRPWRGIGAPTVIPARKRLVDMKRRVFERCARVGHAMVTMRMDGTAVIWTYIRGSGLLGVRLYQATDGTVKRLSCHSHKQRKSRLPVVAAIGNASDPTRDGLGAGHGTAGEDPGASASAGLDTAAGPSLSNSPVLGEVFGHDSPLSDWAGPPPADRPEGRLTPDELRILKCSTLEDLDGTCPLEIVAVQFDVVAAISAAIERRVKRCTVADVTSGREAWSMGSDGGPVRHSAITLFTLTLSAPWLFKGRTAMLPVMYILAGEHHLHSALGDRLDALLTEAVTATYDVPVHISSDESASNVHGSARTGGGTEENTTWEQGSCSWTGPRLVRIVGDFSMLSHIMGLTGGSDDSRCPFWWPCMPRGFLSIGAHAKTCGRSRTVKDIGRQWELVCWVLARWSALRSDLVALDEGSVSVRCCACDTLTPVPSPIATDFRCSVLACGGRTRALGPISPTPLKAMFNLLRRRAGGVRGYPVIRSVPILLQVPVLHCTGSVMKKVTYLFLSELGEARKNVAKHGMYGVTGRANLGDLYLREHIKLVALILACEEIVGVQVDPAVMTMWSLTLTLSAAWRQTLTGTMEHRGKYLHLLELTAGLLAPLWAAIKPLDKEKKGSGVASLYLHAALIHAKDSLGANSPAEAVITDDHVEGAIRDMGRHCGTRVNNISRAQAVTEFQALADDDAATLQRGGFAAELVWYTERIDICGCCSSKLDPVHGDDIKAAVKRADAGDVGNVSAGGGEEGAPTSLHLPNSLVFKPAADSAPVSSSEGKETRIARVLAERLRIVNVCICGAGWDRPEGALCERLLALRQQCQGSSPVEASGRHGTAHDDGHVNAPPSPAGYAAPRHEQPHQVGGSPNESAVVGTAAPVPPEHARSWMVRHTVACRANERDCDGECVEEEDDVFGGCATDVCCGEFEKDMADGGEGDDDGEVEEEAVAITGQGHAPFLATHVVADPDLRTFAPPNDLLHAVLGGDGDDCTGATMDAGSSHHRVAEEDMLLRIFLQRARDPSFAHWTSTSSVRSNDVQDAVKSLLQKLQDVRVSLPGASISTF